MKSPRNHNTHMRPTFGLQPSAIVGMLWIALATVVVAADNVPAISAREVAPTYHAFDVIRAESKGYHELMRSSVFSREEKDLLRMHVWDFSESFVKPPQEYSSKSITEVAPQTLDEILKKILESKTKVGTGVTYGDELERPWKSAPGYKPHPLQEKNGLPIDAGNGVNLPERFIPKTPSYSELKRKSGKFTVEEQQNIAKPFQKIAAWVKDHPAASETERNKIAATTDAFSHEALVAKERHEQINEGFWARVCHRFKDPHPPCEIVR
jgi:hypothetical protein